MWRLLQRLLHQDENRCRWASGAHGHAPGQIRLPNPRIPARIGLLRGMLRAPLCIEMLYQFHPPLWQRLLGSFLELRAQRVPKQIEQRWSS